MPQRTKKADNKYKTKPTPKTTRSGTKLPSGHMWVPGPRAVQELLLVDPTRIVKVLYEPQRSGISAILSLAHEHNIPSKVVSKRVLAEQIEASVARGVVALAKTRPLCNLDELLQQKSLALSTHNHHSANRKLKKLIIALDGVQDPQNLGAIIRSAEFFGANGLFWAKDRSTPITPAVIRASAGASERLPLAVVTNLAQALKVCKHAGYWCLGTLAKGGTPLTQLCTQGLPESLVVVLGSEKNGLRRLTQTHCDYLATIAGYGHIASLNVSAAAAAVLTLITHSSPAQ